MAKQRCKWAKQAREQFGNDELAQIQECAGEKLQEWFPNGDSVFMHDSAPCHKTKSVTKFISESGIKTLSWPCNSQDINTL